MIIMIIVCQITVYTAALLHLTPIPIVQGSGLGWVGQYKAGRPAGLAWQAVQGSAWMVGRLHPDTQTFTGPDIAFLYPVEIFCCLLPISPIKKQAQIG